MNSLIDVITSDDFIKVFSEYVRKHKDLYKFVKIKANLFEELLYNSLSDLGKDVIWTEGSHGTGKDICVDNIKISCKCGIINKNGVWKFSGSRTTSHKTIQEKVNFLKENHDDLIISLAELGNDYVLVIIKSDKISYGSCNEWVDLKKSWKFVNEYSTISIKKSMSDQVWYEINLYNCGISPIYIDKI